MHTIMKRIVIASLAGILLIPGFAHAQEAAAPDDIGPQIEAEGSMTDHPSEPEIIPDEPVEENPLDEAGSPSAEEGAPAVEEGAPSLDGAPVIEDDDPLIEPPAAHENGWDHAEDGTYYWLDGEKVLGWFELDGSTYFFDRDTGAMLSGGIFEVDGECYYFRPAGSVWGPEGSMGGGWVHGYGSPAADYYFDKATGRMYRSGSYTIAGGTYLFGDDGAATTGWVDDGGFRYRYASDGRMCENGIFEVDGEYYYFRGAGSSWGPKGSMGYGWVLDHKGDDYFFDRDTGAMWRGGISEVDGSFYYFRPAGSVWGPEGSIGHGWVHGYGDPAADYYFDRTTGKMYRSGSYTIAGGTYRFDDSGAAVTGWIRSGGYWYCYRSNGRMYENGIYKIDGESYYFRGAGSAWGPRGSMGYGWVLDHRGHDYFFDRSTGAMWRGGMREVDGATYFFRGAGNSWGPEGSIGHGWVRGYGNPPADYFFDRNTGKLITSGWLKDYDTWYYIDPATGEFLTNGIHTINGRCYYFRGANSPWGPEGSMGRGWVRGYGNPPADYFFDRNDGHMYKNGTFIIDGWPYIADSSGRIKRAPARYPAMLDKAQGYYSSTGYLILVDCTNNVFCVYKGYRGNWVPCKEWRCTTGKPSTPTPSGIYYSGAKGYSFGNGYTCYYYTQIYGDYLIHSVLYYQGTFSELDGRLGIHASEGCVRLELSNARWVFDTIPYGTTIVIYR